MDWHGRWQRPLMVNMLEFLFPAEIKQHNSSLATFPNVLCPLQLSHQAEVFLSAVWCSSFGKPSRNNTQNAVLIGASSERDALQGLVRKQMWVDCISFILCLAVFENLHFKEVSCKQQCNNLQASTSLGTGSLCPEFWAAMDFVCCEKEDLALQFQHLWGQ